MKMRGKAAIGTVAGTLLLTSGATAAGVDGVTKFEGKVQRGGTASARIAPGKFPGTNTQTVKVSWLFDGVRLRCGGRKETYAVPIDGSFQIDAHYYEPDDGWGHFGEGSEGLKATMAGGVSDDGVARGWLRVRGSDVPLEGGGADRCDSGRLRWSAKPTD